MAFKEYCNDNLHVVATLSKRDSCTGFPMNFTKFLRTASGLLLLLILYHLRGRIKGGRLCLFFSMLILFLLQGITFITTAEPESYSNTEGAKNMMTAPLTMKQIGQRTVRVNIKKTKYREKGTTLFPQKQTPEVFCKRRSATLLK